MEGSNMKKDAEIQMLEKRVERRDAEIAMLKDRVVRREADIGSLQAKREEARLLHETELKTAVEKCESEQKTVVEKAEAELKKREGEIEKREADVAKRDAETTKLREKLGRGEADNKALVSKASKRESEFKAATSEANKRSSKLESELKAEHKKRDAEAKKMERREQELSKAEQKNINLKAEVKTLSEARSSLEQVVNDQDLAFRANESAVQHECQAVARYYELGAEASLAVGSKVRVAGLVGADSAGMNGREGVISEIFDGRCVLLRVPHSSSSSSFDSRLGRTCCC
jgi:colicin import membrane protein